jgi:hypothetical protein
VQSAAGVLEKRLRDRAPASEVDAARHQVAAALGPLIVDVRAALNLVASEPPAVAVPPTAVNAALSREAAAQLTALLSDLDPAAADFVETNHAALRPLFEGEAWATFATLVQGYAFTDAQAQLAQALETFPAAFESESLT